jgi:hypothetical protein
MVQSLLNHSKYLGFKYGYIAVPFECKFSNDDNGKIMEEANGILEETKHAVIRMHAYVMKIIDKPAFTIQLK